MIHIAAAAAAATKRVSCLVAARLFREITVPRGKIPHRVKWRGTRGKPVRPIDVDLTQSEWRNGANKTELEGFSTGWSWRDPKINLSGFVSQRRD